MLFRSGIERLRSGRRLVLYADDAAALLEAVRHRDDEGGAHLAAALRPTNLEDVFLRVTGTSLEGGA